MSGPGYLLIDYTIFQPSDLDTFDGDGWRVRMFVGASERDLEVAKVSTLLKFGSGLEYIQMDGDGPAAVEAHIAFYLGRLTAANLHSVFCIVAASPGFDSLLRHLRRLGIDCRRLAGGAMSRPPADEDDRFH